MSRTYALVDCASDPGLLRLVRLSKQYACLFEGNIGEEIQAVSPFLVDMETSPYLAREWRERGMGKSWGIFVASNADFKTLRRHFRHFLKAKLPDGREVMFRFYDPRVMRVYLPICTPEEKALWFKEVESFSMEDERGERMVGFTRA